MSAHVAPHRWADLWAGRVDDAERIEMERHAGECKACAKVRRRITRASDSFASIRSLGSPDVSWDTVRARVHWSVSTERRAALRQPRPAYGWLAGAFAAGLAVALIAPQPAIDELAMLASPPARPVVAPAAIAPAGSQPPALVGLVSRAAGDVMIDGIRPGDLFQRKLARGNRIATGDGRVDIQFGDKSAFAIGANSTVELRQFDASTVELAVDGTLDVTVAPRAAGQRFLVDAGDHVIEVRGTQFRVTHEAPRAGSAAAAAGEATTVACRHGLVTVSDHASKIEVGDAHRVRVAEGHPVAAEHVVSLSNDELATLAQATPLTLPAWQALETSSAPLEVATSGRRDVRVDGIELGLAPLRVRVMPGRHTVEAADGAGRFRRAGWVDVAVSGQPSAPIARLDIPADPTPSAGISERERQFRGHIDHPRLTRCMRSIAQAGMTGTYVQIELSVDAQGAVGYLNVVDTDLPSATAGCVREVLADIHFAAGPPAKWRERIDL